MKRMIGITLAGLAALAASAVTLDVPRLPAPAFADREVSGDSALPEGRTNGAFRVFKLEMVFDSTQSNNVQVAFGQDTLPPDGFLSAEETDWIIGWDCGEWFVRPQGLTGRYAFRASVTTGARTLTAAIRVNAKGVPQSAEFKDGGTAFAFPGLALSPAPDWLTPGRWTRLRVTARGADAPEENVRAAFAPDGARVIIR
jgi:hypothetical protein